MSTKNAQGGVGGASADLDRIAREDGERAAAEAARVRRVNQRHGNKGSRVWGFQTGGARKGKRR